MRKYIVHILLVLAIIISSCSSNNSSKGLRPGEEAEITQKCISAIDEDSFDEMTKLCIRKDELGLELMAEKGKIQILYTGTQCVVVETGFAKTKIRLKDGTEVLVANEFVE